MNISLLVSSKNPLFLVFYDNFLSSELIFKKILEVRKLGILTKINVSVKRSDQNKKGAMIDVVKGADIDWKR